MSRRSPNRPAPLERIRLLEGVADRAWPPAEVVALDGWELRFSGSGIGRRVNSVATSNPGHLPLEEKIAACEAFYREREAAPTFKLTRASRPEGLDGALADRGYRLEAPVSVHIRSLARPLTPAGVTLAATPSPAWLEANAAAGGHTGAAPSLFLELVSRIAAPVVFAALEVGGAVAAVGMAVAEGEHAGLFEVATRPEYRRRGLATQVVRALLAWGAERGASTTYLQMMIDNGPARRLYERLGFAEAYRYWYRVVPPSGTPAGIPTGNG